MQKSEGLNESKAVVEVITAAMLDKKANNVLSIDLQQLNERVCDYFVICDADSTTQVQAIADNVLDKVREVMNIKAWHKEGYENSQWILLDYVSVVVHIFQRESRQFYNLENLWADAKIIEHKDE